MIALAYYFFAFLWPILVRSRLRRGGRISTLSFRARKSPTVRWGKSLSEKVVARFEEAPRYEDSAVNLFQSLSYLSIYAGLCAET